MKNKILVTGAAGFIGFHLSMRLAEKKLEIVCIDNINDYYSQDLKIDRLNELGIKIRDNIIYSNKIISSKFKNLSFYKVDISNINEVKYIFENEQFSTVYNLAAQAGVRYSILNPDVYTKSNLLGFSNILINCVNFEIDHLVFASSSSVYGNNTNVPFDENMKIDKPESYYAATKKANELMAFSFSQINKISITGLRYFTVYGPWGRPDMAPFLFCNGIKNKIPINIFNNGNLMRDFTYIDDIIDGTILAANNPKSGKCQIFNIGNGSPINLLNFVELIEKELNISAIKKFQDMQPGDVYKTWANTNKLNSIGYNPKIDVESGIKNYVKWYLNYYN